MDARAPLCEFMAPHPNPDYYSALLWKKTMGERVLQTSVQSAAVDGAAGPWLRAYAHCSPVALGGSGGVSLLLINTHATLPINVSVGGSSTAGQRRVEWHLTAGGDGGPTSKTSLLNGKPLTIQSNGGNGGGGGGGSWSLPSLDGRVVVQPTGMLVIQPVSYTFVSYLDAGAAACKHQ